MRTHLFNRVQRSVKNRSLMLALGVFVYNSPLLLAQTQTFSQATSASIRTKVSKIKEVFVTSSRSERDIASVPLPVSIITAEQIRAQGAVRLDEVLEEQTGLNLVYNHGTGVQMQGLDPAYTLILLDGEPIVGRTAGTMELTRFTVANIERIEIVRGPASSLYGSEALAGVINIITRKPDKPLGASVRARYGAFKIGRAHV